MTSHSRSRGSPRVIRLRSADNDFQRLEVLRRNRQKRQHYRQFFLEGVRPINLALQYAWDVDAFAYAGDGELSDWAKNILRASTADLHLELPGALMTQLSGKTEPSELVAVIRMPPDDLSRITLSDRLCVVVYDRPANPGNLGSLIRSADALGVDGMLLLGHSVDLYDPETISASRGSLFALPVVRIGGPREFMAWLESVPSVHAPVQVVALDEESHVDLWDVDLTQSSILLLGNEKWGLSAGLKEVASVLARIPMDGAASSLNVAAAASIALYELRRQRAQHGRP